jgi:hypothetical protein
MKRSLDHQCDTLRQDHNTDHDKNVNMNARLILSLVVLGLMPLAAVADPPVFVGVIEDTASTDLTPAMSRIHVRLAFQKQGMEWIPFASGTQFNITPAQTDPTFPSTVNWTIVFDGKRLGTITSTNPGLDWSADIGIQTITTPSNDIPRVRTETRDFSLADRRERSRPLLVVSVPNFHDPEGWKITTLTVAEKKLAIAKFRKKFPKMEQCDEPETKPIRMVPYFDDEIVFIKAYRSNSGEVLYGQQLDDTRSKCGFFDDENFFSYWFLLNRPHGVQLLDSQMTPIDAADLDGDGHSEWVFQTSRGEDEDGYELFYDDFTKKASFHWTYH